MRNRISNAQDETNRSTLSTRTTGSKAARPLWQRRRMRSWSIWNCLAGCAAPSIPCPKRRIEAHYILGVSLREIAKTECVTKGSVSISISRGLMAMKKILIRCQTFSLKMKQVYEGNFFLSIYRARDERAEVFFCLMTAQTIRRVPSGASIHWDLCAILIARGKDERRSRQTSGQNGPKRGEPHIFARLLRCSDCGYSLSKNAKNVFGCWLFRTKGKGNCTNHHITLENLSAAALASIREVSTEIRQN